MADDLMSQLSQFGGAILGWSALVSVVGLAAWGAKHGRALGRFEGEQKTRDAQVDKALDAHAAELKSAREKIDGRLDAHAAQLADTREKLARLPDREEMRAWFKELKEDLARTR